MLTRRTMLDTSRQVNRGWWLAGLLALVLFTALVSMLSSWDGFRTPMPALIGDTDMVVELGKALVSPNGYVLPFEVASVLLLAALIGAVVVAWERKP
jgi:NADH-quinone oxidoreductase subunit J